MAVTRTTLKDVGSYEAKFLGPFTIRQSVCLGACAVPAVFIDYLLFNITRDAFVIAFITFIIMAPGVFLAYGSKFCHDMKPEDFIRDYLKYKIMAPPIRLYETKTRDDLIWEEEMKNRKKEEAKTPDPKDKKKKKTKEADATYKIGSREFTKYPHKESKTVREAL